MDGNKELRNMLIIAGAGGAVVVSLVTYLLKLGKK